MGDRLKTPDLLEDWRRYEKSLLTKLANRERELLDLHNDYMDLEQAYNGLWGVIRRQAARDRAAIAERKRLKAANDAAASVDI